MAALGKIRSKGGLLLTILGLALFAFIIGDLLNSSSSLSFFSKQKLGEVDGNEIMINDFQNNVSTFTDFVKTQYGQTPSDGEAREAVWNNFVYSSLLKNEAEKLGLSITDEEFSEAILGANPHPMLRQLHFLCDEKGNFDRKRLASLFAQKDQPGYAQSYKMWLYFENEMKTQMLSIKFQKLLTSSVMPTQKVAELNNSFNSTEYDLVIAKKSYFEIPDSTFKVSDSELRNKYNELKSTFKTEPYRNAEVIVFDVVPSKEDFNNAEYNIKVTKSLLDSSNVEDAKAIATQSSEVPVNTNYLNENQVDFIFKDFAFSSSKGATSEIKLDGRSYKVAKLLSDVEMRPDSVKASRLVVYRNDKESSQALADSLLAEINKGANFDTLVNKFSMDNILKNKGGDMGWMLEGVSGSEEFDEKVFAAKVGEVVSINIQDAVFLVKITDKTKLVKKVKIAQVINNIEPSTETYRDIYGKAKSYIIAHKDIKSFKDSASNYGYRVLPLNHLTQNQSDVPMLPQCREIIKWAWNENTKIGDVSQTVYECDNKYVLVALSEAVNDNYVPLDDVKSRLENMIINDKKAEKMIADMKNIPTDSIWASARIDSIKSVKFADKYVGSIGKEGAILGAIYNVTKDAVVGPIKGNNGVYFVKVADRRDAANNSAESNFENEKLDISRLINASFFEVIKDKAEITDNRYNFY